MTTHEAKWKADYYPLRRDDVILYTAADSRFSFVHTERDLNVDRPQESNHRAKLAVTHEGISIPHQCLGFVDEDESAAVNVDVMKRGGDNRIRPAASKVY